MTDTTDVSPRFISVPSGNTKVLKFTVWNLDVWGHNSDECHKHGCPCVDDHDEHDDNCCQCHYEVNDRFRCGSIEIESQGTFHNVGTPYQYESFSYTDEKMLRLLIEGDFIKEGVTIDQVEFDSQSDDYVDVNQKDNGYPLYLLVKE